MSDPGATPDPVDKAYVEAQALLGDEAARAARRARVLAAVAADVAQAPPSAPPIRRRTLWRGPGFAAAASVAGLGLFLTLEFYKPPERLPPATAPATVQPRPPAMAVQAPVVPARPSSSVHRAPPPTIQPRQVPPPPAAAPPAPPAPSPQAARPQAFPPPVPPPQLEAPQPPTNASAKRGGGRGAGRGGAVADAPALAQATPPQSVDIGGQGARATLTLVDGQRLASGAPAPQAAVAQPAQGLSFDIPSRDAPTALAAWSAASGIKIDAPASLTRGVQTKAVRGGLDPRDALDAMIAGTKLQIIRDDGDTIALGTSGNDTLAAVTVTATGTSIAGIKAVGSPVQRLNREDLLKTGATSLHDALNTLPALQAGGGAGVDYGLLNGADPAARLRIAAAAGRTADITPLLDQGVPINAVDADGDTALMLAVQSDHPDAAGLLRRRGASLDLANKAGRTARDMARSVADPTLSQALGLTP